MTEKAETSIKLWMATICVMIAVPLWMWGALAHIPDADRVDWLRMALLLYAAACGLQGAVLVRKL